MVGYHQPDEGQDRCIPCGIGKYQPKSGAIDCAKCDVGQNSSAGSAECTFCAKDHYRLHAHSRAADCQLCSTIQGVSCGVDTVLATLRLTHAYWRHTNATIQTHRCKSDGSWSPCQGGASAGAQGDGYCANGYRGPRCELCAGPEFTKYFDTLDARCHDCGDVSARATALSTALFSAFLLAAAFGKSIAANRRLSGRGACGELLRWLTYVKNTWRAAGMRYKVKAFVGVYQCIAAVPGVFRVEPPLGMEEYRRWINLIRLPSELERVLVPASCLGDYQAQIWLSSASPVAFLLVCGAIFIGLEAVRECIRMKRPDFAARRGPSAIVTAGLRRMLPLMLGLTFLVVPSTSTRIFRTFLCEPISFGGGETRRYLYADLSLSCDSEEYESARKTAFAMLAAWPVGIPLLYSLLLWTCRKAILTGTPTSLSLATAFLSGDYKPAKFWWEPFEMCRKLTLSIFAGTQTTGRLHSQPIDQGLHSCAIDRSLHFSWLRFAHPERGGARPCPAGAPR